MPGSLGSATAVLAVARLNGDRRSVRPSLNQSRTKSAPVAMLGDEHSAGNQRNQALYATEMITRRGAWSVSRARERGGQRLRWAVMMSDEDATVRACRGRARR
jgi:hypothetical protein